MSSATVLAKAEELQNIARSISEGQKERADQERVLRRIDEVRTALQGAKVQQQTAILLANRTGVTLDTSGFDAARSKLESKSRGGLPSDRAFLDAKRALEAFTNELSTSIKQSWKEWASARIQEVAPAQFVALGPDERLEATQLYESMKANASRPKVDSASIVTFCSSRDALLKILESAPDDAPEDLLELIHRLEAGGVTLRELSDADIALLRKYDQDIWFTVTRKAD
ncbi:hypothetical protein [Streptomyces griseomycini]|uniref:Uncharacterized protein n=1 Tax=Streptomyces griseomycini TaxID=66895 RepID=A0A7W7PUU3_9ACTN|nr:hypothetical protein [Streptomyces griseomycini]MBB4901687.1 hypothetical protein [Streptomyces griseomycini]GGR49882.1 hypothetical protein GCM10015536_64350 [Streptomyces griseomycini]